MLVVNGPLLATIWKSNFVSYEQIKWRWWRNCYYNHQTVSSLTYSHGRPRELCKSTWKPKIRPGQTTNPYRSSVMKACVIRSRIRNTGDPIQIIGVELLATGGYVGAICDNLMHSTLVSDHWVISWHSADPIFRVYTPSIVDLAVF